MGNESLASAPETGKSSLMRPDKHDYFTEAAWPHPVYTKEQMEAIEFAHRSATTLSDKVALTAMKTLRHCFDFATGYHHPKPGHENDPAVAMTERKWLIRCVFLESIAGVPGMVGATYLQKYLDFRSNLLFLGRRYGPPPSLSTSIAKRSRLDRESP